MMARLIATVLVLSTSAVSIADAQGTSTGGDGGVSFHLEGKPAIDDVFGDAADYRRTIDRFLELTQAMQTMRDDFARAVQAVLTELGAQPPSRGRRRCPVDAVAAPFARAHRLGGEYLRIGRELSRHYEQIKEFDRLGESIGLTPDYRWKVRRVLRQYGALLTDYREMKIAFHDQLTDELKFAGCELDGLLARGDPQLRGEPLEPWPQPGQPGAPGVLLAKADKGCAPGKPCPCAPGKPGCDDVEALPPTLPLEKVPPQQPIALPRVPTAPGERAPTRSGVLFYVDNSRCQRGTTVFVDGKRVGGVPAATRVGFQAAPGPHNLCLLDDAKKTCGAPGTVRKSYLHEGWTISLRCE